MKKAPFDALDPQNRPGLPGMKRGPISRHVRLFTGVVRADQSFFDSKGYLNWSFTAGSGHARTDGLGPLRIDVYVGLFEINWDGRTKGTDISRFFLLTEDQKDIRLWTSCNSLEQSELDFYRTEAALEYGWRV